MPIVKDHHEKFSEQYPAGPDIKKRIARHTACHYHPRGGNRAVFFHLNLKALNIVIANITRKAKFYR